MSVHNVCVCMLTLVYKSWHGCVLHFLIFSLFWLLNCWCFVEALYNFFFNLALYLMLLQESVMAGRKKVALLPGSRRDVVLQQQPQNKPLGLVINNQSSKNHSLPRPKRNIQVKNLVSAFEFFFFLIFWFSHPTVVLVFHFISNFFASYANVLPFYSEKLLYIRLKMFQMPSFVQGYENFGLILGIYSIPYFPWNWLLVKYHLLQVLRKTEKLKKPILH